MDQYQLDLQLFLKDLPEPPHDIESGVPVIQRVRWWDMEEASTVEGGKLVKVPVKNVARTNPKFLKYTGQSHLGLLEAWCNGSQLTTCNAFTGKCGVAMGFTRFSLGQFELARVLYDAGIGHAWIPADSGALPRYGDIFRSSKFHVGVSLECDGKTWKTAEGGQGGHGRGCDAVARKEGPWNPGAIQGWVDMATLLAPSKFAPSWLGGWWEVRTPAEVFYYHFGAGSHVSAVKFSMGPRTRISPPPPQAMAGYYALKGFADVFIRWFDSDGTETFRRDYNPGKKKEHMTQMMGQAKASKIMDDSDLVWASSVNFANSTGVKL